jgi:hypothetical protein
MRYIENVLAIIGLVVVLSSPYTVPRIAFALQNYFPECDISIKTAKGMSCYVIKPERK